MKNSTKFTTTIIIIISYLYVFLFTYAAVSKLADYNDFSIKLGQSPLLSPFAGYVALLVPVIELIIVVALCIPKWRLTGLFASFCLMVAFTTYIVIILNFSSFVPCSCGGILENLGWTEHLIFNFVFVALALFAIIVSDNRNDNWITSLKPLAFSATIVGSILLSVGSLVLLFLISEETMHKRNNFVRRFPNHAQVEYNKIDLAINSYYFAGSDDKTIYLGNYTAPAYVTVIDTNLQSKERFRLNPDEPDLPFQDIKLTVRPPYFFITDGTVPAIFRGKLTEWTAKRQNGNIPYFTLAEVMDSSKVALRRTSLKNMQNTLAVYNFNKSDELLTNNTILKKQMDGIFDTDGMLHYNKFSKQLLYLYYYRNQYLTTDTELKWTGQGKTIDTTERAIIKVAKSTDGMQEMAAPPLVINKASCVYKNLLFICSDRLGKFEDAKMLEQTAIIDVYDLNDSTYVGSQYIYDVEEVKLRSFIVIENKIYVLSGKYLTAVKLSEKIAQSYK